MSRPATAPPPVGHPQPTPHRDGSLPIAPNDPTPLDELLRVRHRFTIEEFHRMVDLGVFGDEPKVELIEGMVVDKMGKNPPHVLATDLIQYLLIRSVPAGFFFSMANPGSIEERDSEPEPDAMVMHGNPRDFAGRRRPLRDAALVIEVADSSYSYDHRTKWAVYAGGGVPIFWLLDLRKRRLEVHAEPIGEGLDATYRSSRVYLEGEEAPLVLDGREVARFAVKDILP